MQEAELAAVLSALAGPRRGDRVAAVGAPARALRAVLAATGAPGPSAGGARVALTGADPEQARAAAARLLPGGRLVGLAADAPAAAALAALLGLSLHHVELVHGGVAYAAVAPAEP